MIKVNFVHGTQQFSIDATLGDTILDLRNKDVKLLSTYECACEGSLACSTCHVIVQDVEMYHKTVNACPITDDENDMLDLASGLTRTSRLGCQLRLDQSMDGITLIIPVENRNSGH